MTGTDKVQRAEAWLRMARQIVGNRPSDRPDRARYDTLIHEFRRDFPGLPEPDAERIVHELRRICGV